MSDLPAAVSALSHPLTILALCGKHPAPCPGNQSHQTFLGPVSAMTLILCKVFCGPLYEGPFVILYKKGGNRDLELDDL